MSPGLSTDKARLNSNTARDVLSSPEDSLLVGSDMAEAVVKSFEMWTRYRELEQQLPDYLTQEIEVVEREVIRCIKKADPNVVPSQHLFDNEPMPGKIDGTVPKMVQARYKAAHDLHMKSKREKEVAKDLKTVFNRRATKLFGTNSFSSRTSSPNVSPRKSMRKTSVLDLASNMRQRMKRMGTLLGTKEDDGQVALSERKITVSKEDEVIDDIVARVRR